MTDSINCTSSKKQILEENYLTLKDFAEKLHGVAPCTDFGEVHCNECDLYKAASCEGLLPSFMIYFEHLIDQCFVFEKQLFDVVANELKSSSKFESDLVSIRNSYLQSMQSTQQMFRKYKSDVKESCISDCYRELLKTLKNIIVLHEKAINDIT